jgi:hypothetical protein
MTRLSLSLGRRQGYEGANRRENVTVASLVKMHATYTQARTSRSRPDTEIVTGRDPQRASKSSPAPTGRRVRQISIVPDLRSARQSDRADVPCFDPGVAAVWLEP